MIEKNGKYSRKELMFYNWKEKCSFKHYELWVRENENLVYNKHTFEIILLWRD
jgi:hypothetical protein